MEAIGLVSATHLYLLASTHVEEGAYLTRLVAHACREQLHRAALRLLRRTWPFSRERTEHWFAEQFHIKADSVATVGGSPHEVESLHQELAGLVTNWCNARSGLFPDESPRRASRNAIDRAASLVPARTTLGSPKAWGSLALTGEQEQTYRRVLYDNNLDLLFHRICYWADGRRSLLDIVGRLEFELDELKRDTSIARTSSGSLIHETPSVELDLKAVLYVTDLLIQHGYLSP